MDFLIRPAIVSDREDIQALYSRLHRPARTEIDISEYLVAVAGHDVVGCAGVCRAGCGGYLFGLAVDAGYRRQGIGSALTRARMDRVREQDGAFAVALSMFWNARFFRSLGFDTIPRAQLPQEVLRLDDLRSPTYRRSSVMFRNLVDCSDAAGI